MLMRASASALLAIILSTLAVAADNWPQFRGTKGGVAPDDPALPDNWSLYNPSPLVYGGCYYTLLDRGFLTCHDPKTGKEIYGRQRITMDATNFTASLWAYNGKVFALSEDGDTYVMQAGPEFKVLGKNPLGEMSLATPAVANGSLIIRTASKLYRISRPR